MNLSNSVAIPQKGFTLTEVLVSSSILIVLLVILVGLGDKASRFWQASEGRRETDRRLRTAIGVIEHDLRNAILLESSPGTLRITSSPGPGGESCDSLFFVTEEERREGSGESPLRVVGYFVEEDPSSPGNWNLYRHDVPWPQNGSPFTGETLSSLQSAASRTEASSTEILARHVGRLSILPLSGHRGLADALEITFAPAGWPASRHPGISALLSLPPWRESLHAE